MLRLNSLRQRNRNEMKCMNPVCIAQTLSDTHTLRHAREIIDESIRAHAPASFISQFFFFRCCCCWLVCRLNTYFCVLWLPRDVDDIVSSPCVMCSSHEIIRPSNLASAQCIIFLNWKNWTSKARKTRERKNGSRHATNQVYGEKPNVR